MPSQGDQLVGFLRARYAEARAAIEALPKGPWQWEQVGDPRADVLAGPEEEVLASGDAESYSSWIDRHGGFDGFLGLVQPDQLLADLEAKLGIVDWYETASTSPELNPDAWQIMRQVLLLLALPFAAHPDYDERWRP